MADLKISALTGATTPLAGTEVLPIVQSSTTVKVAVSNLTAGRAVSMLSGTATDFLLVGNSAGAKYARIQSTGNGAQVNLDIFGKTGGGADAGFAIGIGVTGDKGLEFQDNATGVVRVELAQAGNLKLNSGNLVIGTDGKGIDFSATAGTGTSELFADYEEGNWTPVVTASAGSITSYTSSGNYTKVGRVVVVSGFITITNNGTGSGNGNIAGLPFTVGGQGASGCSRSAAAGGHMVNIQILSGGTTFTMWMYDNTYPFLTNSELAFSFSYFV